MSAETKRTPAEEARAEVESLFPCNCYTWQVSVAQDTSGTKHNSGCPARFREIAITRLTPVFERAQRQIDAQGYLVTCPWCADSMQNLAVPAQIAHLITHGDALRERAERAEHLADTAAADCRNEIERAERAAAESAGRLRTLNELHEERRELWKRAENAEAERDEARRERDEWREAGRAVGIEATIDPKRSLLNLVSPESRYTSEVVELRFQNRNLADDLARLRVELEESQEARRQLNELVDVLADDNGRLRVREGQAQDALQSVVDAGWIDHVETWCSEVPQPAECTGCAVLAYLSSPSDAPDVLGAIRSLVEHAAGGTDCEICTKLRATLCAAGIVQG